MHIAVGLLLLMIASVRAAATQKPESSAPGAAQINPQQSLEPFLICSKETPRKGCTYACDDPNRPKEERRIESPRPTFAPDPESSEQARRKKVKGMVLLEVIVDDKGQITSAKVVRSLEPELDRNSLKTVSRWQFDPAKLEGKAVPVRLIITVSFRNY